MSDTRIWTLRTIAKTPWGFMGYVATTLDEVNPITLEKARKTNLRAVQDRLTPGGTFPGQAPRTPVADTTIRVSETLVAQDLMSDGDDEHLEKFEEYEIPYWKMTG